MIRLDNVSKHYGGHIYALSNISVEIKDGDFVFLIGPSGAGKTTLLRLLIRDLLPTSGNVYLDEWHVNMIPVSQVHLLRRRVGTVFQDFKLLSDRTVFENVAVGLEILGKTDGEIKKDVMDVLALVGLSDKLHMFPKELSAGELQRTAIARALAGGPKVLLADEPTGNLDPETAAEILHIFLEVNKVGTTVLMATHNVTIVNHLSKRTIVLTNGALVGDEEKGKYVVPQKRRQTHQAAHHGDSKAGEFVSAKHHEST